MFVWFGTGKSVFDHQTTDKCFAALCLEMTTLRKDRKKFLEFKNPFWLEHKVFLPSLTRLLERSAFVGGASTSRLECEKITFLRVL